MAVAILEMLKTAIAKLSVVSWSLSPPLIIAIAIMVWCWDTGLWTHDWTVDWIGDDHYQIKIVAMVTG